MGGGVLVGVGTGVGVSGTCVGLGGGVGVKRAAGDSGGAVAAGKLVLESSFRRAGFLSSDTPVSMQPCDSTSKANIAISGNVLIVTFNLLEMELRLFSSITNAEVSRGFLTSLSIWHSIRGMKERQAKGYSNPLPKACGQGYCAGPFGYPLMSNLLGSPELVEGWFDRLTTNEL